MLPGFLREGYGGRRRSGGAKAAAMILLRPKYGTPEGPDPRGVRLLADPRGARPNN